MVSGLNADQDISVKALSCKEVLQEAMTRNSLSETAAKILGEVFVCSLMMGSGLKGEETLQINFVGDRGIRNVMAITNGSLAIKGMVGEANFTSTSSSSFDIFGHGQLQIVRDSPTWKNPMNGIVELQDTDIPMNMALYMAQSEQRSAVVLADVKIKDGKCVHALGLFIEALPFAKEENIEISIANAQRVQSRQLSSYIIPEDFENQVIPTSPFAVEDQLQNLLDDCFTGLGSSIRYSKTPKFHCECSIDRVWRALKLLPKQDIEEIVEEEKDIETKCGFCGKSYSVSTQEITKNIIESITN